MNSFGSFGTKVNNKDLKNFNMNYAAEYRDNKIQQV